MKPTKLFTRKENGRYEPYKEPPCEDNKLYIKRNGKYEPWGMELKADSLQEGVWVVTRERNQSGISGKFLRDIYTIEKCSNLQGLSIAQLGNIHKLCEESYREVKDERIAIWELFEKRVGYIIDKLIKND